MFGHWYVVASQKTVKVFTEAPGRGELKHLKSLDNPLGRERNRALIRKQAGRGMKYAGRGALHYTSTKRHHPHEEAAAQFAKEVAHFLAGEVRQKNFKSLTIVAEPHFLGKLKAAMGPDLNKLVIEWIQKDLLKTPQPLLLDFLLPKNEKAVFEASP